jgi:hypothetical protein
MPATVHFVRTLPPTDLRTAATLNPPQAEHLIRPRRNN